MDIKENILYQVLCFSFVAENSPADSVNDFGVTTVEDS